MCVYCIWNARVHWNAMQKSSRSLSAWQIILPQSFQKCFQPKSHRNNRDERKRWETYLVLILALLCWMCALWCVRDLWVDDFAHPVTSLASLYVGLLKQHGKKTASCKTEENDYEISPGYTEYQTNHISRKGRLFLHYFMTTFLRLDPLKCKVYWIFTQSLYKMSPCPEGSRERVELIRRLLKRFQLWFPTRARVIPEDVDCSILTDLL